MRLMQRIRDAIKEKRFPSFVVEFVRTYYSSNCENDVKANKRNEEKESIDNFETSLIKENTKNKYNIPEWVVNALNSVNIDVLKEI
jgi:hypothetical protein